MAKQTKSLDTCSELVISNIDLLTEIFLRLPPKHSSESKPCPSADSPSSPTQNSASLTPANTLSGFQFPTSTIMIFVMNYPFPLMATSFRHCPFLNVFNETRVFSNLIFLILVESYCYCQGCVSNLPLIVLNPITQKYKVLPDPPYYLRRPVAMPFCMFLAFEPSKSNQYKIVMWNTVIGLQRHFSISIFSSETGSWKLSSVTAPTGTDRATSCIFWNGAIHWLDTSNFHCQFDVDAQVITYNQLPPKPKIRDCADYFGESNGRLFLIQRRRKGALGFQMLELNRDLNCWVTRHLVNIRPLALQFSRIVSEPEVLYVKTGADMGSFSMILATPEKIFLYKLKKGRKSQTEIKVIGEFPKEIYSYYLRLCNLVHPFVQSLALV